MLRRSHRENRDWKWNNRNICFITHTLIKETKKKSNEITEQRISETQIYLI